MRVIINVPDCQIDTYKVQQNESYDTWIPLVNKKGFEVIKSVSNPNLNSEYFLSENILYCKCEDTLDHNFILKRFYFIKWALENKDFDYLFITSFDTFIHSERFLTLIEEYIELGNIDAAGAIYPYQGWNPYENFKFFLLKTFNEDPNILLSGGSGYLLSPKSCKIIVDNFHNEDNLENKPWDDFLFSQILRKNGIHLFHDNRFMYSSPQQIIWSDTNNIGVPRIDEDSGNFLVAQHPLNGKMYEIVKNLKLM